MLPLVMALIGFTAGAALVFFLLDKARRQWRSLQPMREKLSQDMEALRSETARLEQDRRALDARVVSFHELEQENGILKRDLLNIDVSLRKLEIDRRLQVEAQAALDGRGRELAERYLADIEKWVGESISANNYAASQQRLVKAIEWSREIGFEVPQERESRLLADLRHDYEMKVRTKIEREEQDRIKEQIREEIQREKEIQRELESLDRERAAIKAALDAALAQATDAHSEGSNGCRPGSRRRRQGASGRSRRRSSRRQAISTSFQTSDHLEKTSSR